MKLKPITVLNGFEYFAEITVKIAATKRGDRVGLMSMSLDPTEKRTKPLFHELIAAAKRGVLVQFNIDAHSFMIDDSKTRPTGPLLKYYDVSKSHRADYQAKYETLEKLREAGGNYCITNMPGQRLTNPFTGRSHIKLCIIKNSSYIGGSNLSKSWQIDLMARIDDAKTVDFAWDFMQRVAKAKSVIEAMSGHDVTHKVDDATTIYIDAGVKKQSLIYVKALNFIDGARKNITMTCQFFPGNPTSRHLAEALKRGVKVDIYFQASQLTMDFLSVPHYVVELTDRIKHPKELFANPVGKNVPRLHSKLIATEKGAMIGSHNFVPQGVNFGTAEITLLRRNPEFSRQAIEKLESSLRDSRINKKNPNL